MLLKKGFSPHLQRINGNTQQKKKDDHNNHKKKKEDKRKAIMRVANKNKPKN